MQIDFHHAVTYVTARCAGFSHPEADVIAYAAQYVDDSTCDGTVCFNNMAMYTRISSAHKTVDPENLNDVSNHLVWLPFHFLPGNAGTKERGKVGDKFIDKIICLPGPQNTVANDMLDAVIDAKGKANSLHRLGVTMHVYADTWAHQGFAGVLHEVNEVDDVQDESGTFKDIGNVLSSWLAEKVVPPLGHGRAQVFPDMPFLRWSYTNGHGKQVSRDNTGDFSQAADAMCRFMQRYRQQQVIGLSDKDRKTIESLFSTLNDVEGEKRHSAWVNSIAKGDFSFGEANISYDADGRNSWKAKALGTVYNMPVHTYRDDFLESDWKLFHDALQQHRLMLLHDILPKYGICAA